jgi:hypothetical protein
MLHAPRRPNWSRKGNFLSDLGLSTQIILYPTVGKVKLRLIICLIRGNSKSISVIVSRHPSSLFTGLNFLMFAYCYCKAKSSNFIIASPTFGLKTRRYLQTWTCHTVVYSNSNWIGENIETSTTGGCVNFKVEANLINILRNLTKPHSLVARDPVELTWIPDAFSLCSLSDHSLEAFGRTVIGAKQNSGHKPPGSRK